VNNFEIEIQIFSVGDTSDSQSHVFFGLLGIVKITNDGSKRLNNFQLELVVMTF